MFTGGGALWSNFLPEKPIDGNLIYLLTLFISFSPETHKFFAREREQTLYFRFVNEQYGSIIKLLKFSVLYLAS